jgi:hypothetical protein
LRLGGGEIQTVPSDPWTFLDGRLNAPAGPPQFPNQLNTYVPGGIPAGRYKWPSVAARNSTTGNLQQPPWQVAGIDYATGVPAGKVLADWQTATPPAGVTRTNAGSGSGAIRQWKVTSDNVTIDGIDFSTGGGATVWFNGVNGGRLTNCNFGYTTAPASLNAIGFDGNTTVGSYVGYNTFNGNGSLFAVPNEMDTISFNGNGLVVEYNYFLNCCEDIVQTGSNGSCVGGNVVSRYNLIKNNGKATNTPHPDWTQFGSGIYTISTLFNTTIMDSSGTDGWWLLGGTINFFECAYNTIMALTGGSVNYPFGVATAANTGIHGGIVNGPGTTHDNYMDNTTNAETTSYPGTANPALTVFAGIAYGDVLSYQAGVSTFLRNIEMKSGNFFDNYNGTP